MPTSAVCQVYYAAETVEERLLAFRAHEDAEQPAGADGAADALSVLVGSRVGGSSRPGQPSKHVAKLAFVLGIPTAAQEGGPDAGPEAAAAAAAAIQGAAS